MWGFFSVIAKFLSSLATFLIGRKQAQLEIKNNSLQLELDLKDKYHEIETSSVTADDAYADWVHRNKKDS